MVLLVGRKRAGSRRSPGRRAKSKPARRKVAKNETPAQRGPGGAAKKTTKTARKKPSSKDPFNMERVAKKLRRELARIQRAEQRLERLREREEGLRTIEAKRRHRRELTARADEHWKGLGEEERRQYLEAVRAALEKEGFKSTMFQWRHRGHAYGLVKDLGDKQIHVRVYDNGIIDAEMEIHKRYLQHLYSPRPSAHSEVMEILAKHGLVSHLVNEHYLPQMGADRAEFPKRRTRVSHLLSGAAAVGSMVAVSVARIALDRRKGKNG